MRKIENRLCSDIFAIESQMEFDGVHKAGNGFILNDWKERFVGDVAEQRWNVLHKASCSKLRQKGQEAKVSKDFKKKFSAALDSLEEWCRIHRGGSCGDDGKAVWKHCGTCFRKYDGCSHTKLFTYPK